MTLLEGAANTLATLSILLAGRNSVHTWWTGMAGCSLFAVLFWQTRLYADVLLQVFFVVASIVGWWHWSRRGAEGDGNVHRTGAIALAWMTLAAAIATVGYGTLLHRFTDAYAPFADSFVLAVSVLAQLLLMRRRIETWPVWLLVNTVAVPLYASRGLTVTAVLYAAYWVNALVAWRHWVRLSRTEASPA
ncbi:nicotinamide mononucleotide transporter [Luteibacter sp. 1214]|uniref:nicotinamide riboside transporter PnuC n=1 Tax=Luteibacter sp. 1214 TaxID=2817735 RepID=UPI002860CAA7|nr:nicotinamide riboside transporter PnuC [Luteibacter sp. 1214]MDR6641137.1 nicotinamide mononucleotide transporter [Luteibacter sp. 1214]